MNAKQEAEKCNHEYSSYNGYYRCESCDDRISGDDYLYYVEQKLEATERKLAEAEKVVEAADKLSISETWDVANTDEWEAMDEALSDYEASKEYTSQEEV